MQYAKSLQKDYLKRNLMICLTLLRLSRKYY